MTSSMRNNSEDGERTRGCLVFVREGEIKTDRKTDREADRQTNWDSKTDKQRERQRQRQRQTDRYREADRRQRIKYRKTVNRKSND